MHKCKYCNTSYYPRPQVKNPQACNKEECQRARQRDNEKHWREQNKTHYSKDYFEIQKDKRKKTITEKTNEIFNCLEVGKNMLNKNINLNIFREYFEQKFLQLGIRLINKLWPMENTINSNTL
ncbi:MAG: hypothetical protein HQK49_08200 [Oligoflexia bacterium]|nr:hypothetical protein [Oligoflexia bacterium]